MHEKHPVLNTVPSTLTHHKHRAKSSDYPEDARKRSKAVQGSIMRFDFSATLNDVQQQTWMAKERTAPIDAAW